VILDEPGYNTFSRQMAMIKLPLINLAISTPINVIALLSSVTIPQNGRYNTFLLKTRQARGLDIPTSFTIEKAGGIYVAVAVLPRTFRELE
jgi:hypothetical protein